MSPSVIQTVWFGFKSQLPSEKGGIFYSTRSDPGAAGAGLGGRRNLLAGPLLPAHPICLPFLLSYAVLGLVLLELGWAGVGISWLALF
jgi:hypothetical protein